MSEELLITFASVWLTEGRKGGEKHHRLMKFHYIPPLGEWDGVGGVENLAEFIIANGFCAHIDMQQEQLFAHEFLSELILF